VASAILVELNIRLTVLVVETARLERRGVNDSYLETRSHHVNMSFIILRKLYPRMTLRYNHTIFMPGDKSYRLDNYANHRYSNQCKTYPRVPRLLLDTIFRGLTVSLSPWMTHGDTHTLFPPE
jgi:hypothetical protein